MKYSFKEHPESIRHFQGEQHGQWKGDNAKYTTKHSWVHRHFGKAYHCEHCGSVEIPKGKQRWFEWSNISRTYKRERSDWQQLCKPCHEKFDYEFKPKGEQKINAKLNHFKVQRIRLMKEIVPTLPQRKLAKMFGVSQRAIVQVLHKITWKHIQCVVQ